MPVGKVSKIETGEVSTGVAAKLAGLHPQTLRRWAERGAIKPHRYGRARHDRGAVLGWTLAHIVAARAIKKLRERVSAQHLRLVVQALDKHGENLANAVLIADPRDRNVYRVLAGGDLARALDGQVRAVALSPIVSDVRREARKAGVSFAVR